MKARPEGGRISIQLTTYRELCTMKLYQGRELASSLAFIPQRFLPPDLDKVQLLPRAAWKQTTVHLPLVGSDLWKSHDDTYIRNLPHFCFPLSPSFNCHLLLCPVIFSQIHCCFFLIPSKHHVCSSSLLVLCEELACLSVFYLTFLEVEVKVKKLPKNDF